jgi:hypothetical protein
MAACLAVVEQEVEVLPGHLPVLRERVVPSPDSLTDSVSSINHSENALIPKEWDVFISHAHEDKDDIVRPLAYALRTGERAKPWAEGPARRRAPVAGRG